MNSMQAIQFDREKGRLSLIQTPVPAVSNGGVLVRVAYAGICGSDLHIIQKEVPSADIIILGHEMSGTVEKVGQEVTRFKPGERVTINPSLQCGACRFCQDGQVNICQKTMYEFTGIGTNGGWAEYCAVDQAQVIKIPDSMPLDRAVLCEPYSCVLRGWENLGFFPSDSRVLILGAGIIGLLHVLLYHHHGHRNVTVTEIADGRRKLAEGMGLGYNILHPGDLAKKMAVEDIDQEGFDIVIDCTGSTKAVEAAIKYMRRGGKLCLFGNFPLASEMTINPSDIVFKELSIIGTILSCFTFSKAVSLVNDLAEGSLEFGRLGIEIFSLSEYDHAIAKLRRGEISKALFNIGRN